MNSREDNLQQFQIGKDEMNLVEFPITLISKRPVTDRKTIKFDDVITGHDGKPLTRKWIVSGSDEFGLPLAQDNDVLLALLILGKKNNFASPTINFSRYKLLRIMGWNDDGKSYQRIKESLQRLLGVTIYAENAFWDNEKKRYITLGFGIIDAFSLFDSYKTSKQEPLALSSVELNKYMYQSIRAGYIKSIDIETYFKLQSDVAKRLYRYLDKKRYEKTKFEINIFTLTQAHIGLAKTRYASHIKEKLEPAHKELMEAGFMHSVEYQKTADGDSEKVVYTFGKRAGMPGKEEEKRNDSGNGEEAAILKKLISLGINRKIAEQLIKEYPLESIDSQIRALPYRKANDVPAVLVSAIQGEWDIPAAYQKCREKEKMEEAEKIERHLEGCEKAKRRAAIENYLAIVSLEEKEKLKNEALDLLRQEGGAFFQDKEIPDYMLNGYVHMVVEKRLEKSNAKMDAPARV